MKFSFIVMVLSAFLFSYYLKLDAKIKAVDQTLNQSRNEAIVWSFKTGSSVYAKPLILDSVVYIGSLDSIFYALNVLTGAEIWHYQTDNQIYSSAVVSENTLCFESGNRLYGLDLNGGLKWVTPLAAGPVVNRHDEWDDYHSSPKIADGIAYIGSELGQVFGVNLANGSVVFQVQSPEPRSTVETTPVIYNGNVYFGDWTGIFYAYELSTSRMVWKYDTRNDNTYTWVNNIQNEAVIWKNNVLFGGRNCNLYSLNSETGAKNWMYHDPYDMWLLGGPLIINDVLYMGASNQFFIQAFNPVNGEKLWTQNVDGRIFGTPVTDDNYLFFGTGIEYYQRFGAFYVADRISGRLLNRIAFEGQVHSSPAARDGILYFGCTDGHVFAVAREKLLANPLPNTGFVDISDLRVGEIPGNLAACQIQMPICNRGVGADSVTVSFSNLSSMLRKALTLAPRKFILAANDTQSVTIGIDATKLKVGEYMITLKMTSKSNLFIRDQSRVIRFTISAVSEVESGEEKVPDSFSIGQNYPNPFNAWTTIRYSVARNAFINLKVFNALGEEIAVLVNAFKAAGNYRASFDATSLTSGVYFYQYSAGEKNIVRKMSLLR